MKKQLNQSIHLTAFTLVMMVFAGFTQIASAQKFAYVDTDYILSELPDYKAAQKKIDDMAKEWQKEIDAKYSQIDKMYKDYSVEKVLLNAEQQKKREEEIIAKEKEVKKLQQEKFGYEGELFKKRQELIKPIQDRVYEAIQKIAKREDLDFIFDKSGDMVMLFSNARYDKSGEVLEELGITPLDKKGQDDGPGDTPPDNNLPPQD